MHLNNAGVFPNQLAAVVRDLRVIGFNIPKNQRVKCAEHGTATADQLTSSVPTQPSTLRYAYTAAEHKQIMSHCGNQDAYDGDRSAGLQLDHRVPMIRAQANEGPIDPTDPKSARSTFMCLTPQHNLRKSRAGVETGERPLFFNKIPFWHEGTQTYDPKVGCRGCPWAYPEQWYQTVADRLTGASALPEAK